MAWSERRALERIQGHIAKVPADRVTVEGYEAFRQRRTVLVEASVRDGGSAEPIWRIPENQAVLTHGVHIYANLIDFNATLTDGGEETPKSHERAMQFLHLHYGASDALIEAFDVQRVDYHGARLHAVVLDPPGLENEGERIAKALAFSAALIDMVRRAGDRYGQEFRTQVRIGIDSGPAVAINNGKRDEPDPLFVGSPANHAAKLAVGEESGVYTTARVERARWMGDVAAFGDSIVINEGVVTGALDNAFDRAGLRQTGKVYLEEAFTRFAAAADEARAASIDQRLADFSFSHRTPPLASIVFAEHPPSRAIRMELASIFADLDGYTAYIDQAILAGQVAQAVSNLYVVRAELADVLQEDFGGRKVRFIGDCLHGILAEGDKFRTAPRDTVFEAVIAAGALRSSFDLCRAHLPGFAVQGIAIGIEYGPTPIARIGMRGDASVRCSTSKATCNSETVQCGCAGDQTAIGEKAYEIGGWRIAELFGQDRVIAELTYDEAAIQLEGSTTTASGAVDLQAHSIGD